MTIWCVGRNYAKHAKEMGAEIPTSPLIFQKSGGCLNHENTITLPKFSKEIHHELELALLIGDDLTPKSLALALDLTARDHQNVAKDKGQPWTLAKSFIGSCPISHWTSYVEDSWFENLEFELQVNSEVRQRGSVSDMIFKPAQLLETIKAYFPLKPGDIVLTGTPEGVGPIQSGDKIRGEIKGLLQCEWQVS